MIVVDTNVIGYLYLSSERAMQAEKVLLKDALWAAPLLWRSEFRNVLTTYIRKSLLGLGDAQQIMENALHLMRDREYEVASLPVLSMAVGCSCTAYDCEFVALAKELGVPLITVDRQILAQFPQVAISLEAYIQDGS